MPIHEVTLPSGKKGFQWGNHGAKYASRAAAERQAAAAHANGFVGDVAKDAKWHAAGILFVAPDGDVLLVRRSPTETNYGGYWALPGGKAEEGEEPEVAADRESREELGDVPEGRKKILDRRVTPTGMAFHTFVQPVAEKFIPTLNGEHTGYAWASLNALPRPLHPGIVQTLRDQLDVTEDMSSEDWRGLIGGFVKWASEEAAEPEHAEDASEKAIGERIKREIDRGHSPAQAAAIAYSELGQDAKLSKEAVGYSEGRGDDRCRNCTHFENGACEIVAGTIDPDHWCEFFLVAQSAGATYATDSNPRHTLIWQDGRWEPLALDRKSARTYDRDGRLHVASSNISKAAINEYLGREIPEFESLGLDPAKRYRLLRDPKELAKAAPTFNNLPLLSRHVPVTADAHPSDLVIGSLGTDAEFASPYLKNSLVVWRRDGIDDIESEAKKELSSAYRYRADMTPGTFEGQPYDGVMRDIVGNHVALVREGRAGDDVVVGDSAIPPKIEEVFDMTTTVLSRKAVMAQGAVLAFLLPKLAQDAKIDLSPVFTGVSPKNFKEKKAAIMAGITKATKGKLAQDADISDVAKMLDALGDVEVAEGADADPNTGLPMAELKNEAMDADRGLQEKLREFLKGKVSPEDMAKIDEMIGEKAAEDETPEEKEAREKKEAEEKAARDNMVTKPAMDAAIAAAVKTATETAAKNARETREAERAVRPYVGELTMAHDSAESVYRTALTALGVKVDGVHPSAFPALLEAQPKPGSRKTESLPAMDAAAVKDFDTRFPHAAKIGTL